MSEMERKRAVKVPSGIAGLDLVSKGGLPAGRAVVVAGTAGSGKTVFASQFLSAGIADFDQPGVFVTSEESPADIRATASRQLLVDLGEMCLLDENPMKASAKTRGSLHKTGSSRRRFVHESAGMISLHQPHPGNELKAYQVELVLEALSQEGLI